MIALRRLDLVRMQSPSTADELASLQTQLNAKPLLAAQTRITIGDPGPLVPVPSGYVELLVGSTVYVLPFYARA